MLKFHGPGMCRNRPDVGNIFMQCLNLLRRYFVPLPWRFLTQPELQQGSDRLNCNQKHILVWYAIKINCIYINEQVASIFSCNLRSDSELERHLEAQHFPSLPPGKLYFWRPEISSRLPEILAGGPKFCTGGYEYVPAQNVDLSTWVSAMPPVDNYISIFLLKNRDRP